MAGPRLATAQDRPPGPLMPFSLRTAAYGLALVIMIGWVLRIGQAVLMPVLFAVIALYILSAASEALGRMPGLRLVSPWVLRLLTLIGFGVALVWLLYQTVGSFARVVAALPGYESNLDRLVSRGAALAGINTEPSWAAVRAATLDRFDATSLIAPIADQVTGIGGAVFLTVLYASFILAERVRFGAKLARATADAQHAERLLTLMRGVNERIGRYLLTKTLVNALLGVMSYFVLLLIGIEFPAFWAILIAVLNYVPYLGSLLGVVLPTLLALAQFGTFAMAIVTLVALTVAQVIVGAVIEPRMMGRAVNLSPFIVLLSLAFWGALWGIAGAVLAIPLTASLVILLAEIPATRPFAIMLSANGRV